MRKVEKFEMKERNKGEKLRSIDSEKPILRFLNSKERLKYAITDFIIHDKPGSQNRKMKNRIYQPIKVRLQVNGKHQNISIELHMLFQKYTSLRKCEVQNGVGIQNLTLGILEFIDQIQQQSGMLSLEVRGEVTSEKILHLLVEKHFQSKRREQLQEEYDQAKKIFSTKYKKVIFNEKDKKEDSELNNQNFSETNSQRVSRNTMSSLMDRQQSSKKHLQLPKKSKLKTLVDLCNVFDFPQRVQALRKQKLIKQFCDGKEFEYIKIRQQVKKHYACPSTTLSSETIQQLQDWINDISASELMFKQKYEPQSQQKQNKYKVQSPSSSEDQLP